MFMIVNIGWRYWLLNKIQNCEVRKMNEVKEGIVNTLIEQGLTVEEMQQCYERYVWHYNFYEPKLKHAEELIKFLYEMVNPLDLSEEQKKEIEAFIK